MLLNLYKKKWNEGLKMKNQKKSCLSEVKRLSKQYSKWIEKENETTIKKFNVSSVGKVNPKRHLLEEIEKIQEDSILDNFQMMMNVKVF